MKANLDKMFSVNLRCLTTWENICEEALKYILWTFTPVWPKLKQWKKRLALYFQGKLSDPYVYRCFHILLHIIIYVIG